MQRSVTLPQFKDARIRCGPRCGIRHKCRHPAYGDWREAQTGAREFPCPFDDGLIVPDGAKVPPAKFVAPANAEPKRRIPSPPDEVTKGIRRTCCAECDKMVLKRDPERPATPPVATCSVCTQCGGKRVESLVGSVFVSACQHPLRLLGYGWSDKWA